MTDEKNVYFDDALARLIGVVRHAFGDKAAQDGLVLRDANGRLSFVVPSEASKDNRREAISQSLFGALGPYARPDDVLIYGDDPGAGRLLMAPDALPMQMGGFFCRLLDRRIVGSGWLDAPKDESTPPPRVVFASLKGGVGRSTALTVAAADLARRNRNVLVIDLDLEAPGLGDLLIDEESIPDFGVLDFLVENGIGGVPDAMLGEFIGISALTSSDGGRVDVVPALGRRSLASPENVLPKLARAMIDDLGNDGDAVSVSHQISEMTRRLASREHYDVLLVDSRAGLAELSAPAILGLGATVLLFGTAQKQTIEGYRSLFAGLRLLAQRDRAAGRKAEWRFLLKAVYAKASLNNNVASRYREDLYELFAEYIYDEEGRPEPEDDDVNFDIDDISAPHWPLTIPFSQNFVDFNPLSNPMQLVQPFYEQTFRPFLDGLDAIIASTAVDIETGGSEEENG